MSQVVKGELHKHEDSSSIPSTHTVPGMVVCICKSNGGETDGSVTGQTA